MLKHLDRVRSGVHREQHRAVGVFNDILIRIERPKAKWGRKADSISVVLVNVGPDVKVKRYAKIELSLVLLFFR
jgi:hypothetical protein